MPDSVSRQPRLLFAAILIAVIVAGLGVTESASGSGVGALSSQLSKTQAHEQSLSTSISSLNNQVSDLDGQISLVQKRELAAEATLNGDRAALAGAKRKLEHQKQVLKRLQAKLKLAQKILDRQLVSQYEQPQQSLVSVVLNANGFSQLLSELQDLKTAQQQQQAIINFTRKAKAAAEAAELKVSKLASADETAAAHAQTQTNALAGMRALLSSRQTALSHAREAQSAALAESQAHGAALQNEITRVQQQEAAAQAAAEAAAQASQQASSSDDTSVTSAGSGAYDGWAIPYSIVLCESGGQNLPPNSAGASGYYQIMPATWTGSGGTGPAAYLASRAEQSAIAAKIWDGGAGASNWVCAGIVGIS